MIVTIIVVILYINIEDGSSNKIDTSTPLYQKSGNSSSFSEYKPFTAQDDTILCRANPEDTHGGLPYLITRNTWGSGSNNIFELSTLIRFDISTLPRNATILSAHLRLYYYSWEDSNPTGRPLTLYRILDDWHESNVVWAAQPRYVDEPTATAYVPSNFGYLSWDVTGDCRLFFKGEQNNFGWRLSDNTFWGQPNVPQVFFSSKDNDSNKPYLEIEYIV